jgi:PAS domain-containing protein
LCPNSRNQTWNPEFTKRNAAMLLGNEMIALIQDFAVDSIFEVMKEPILILDTEGLIVYVNSIFERVFSLVPPDVVEEHFPDLSPSIRKIDSVGNYLKQSQFIETPIPTIVESVKGLEM